MNQNKSAAGHLSAFITILIWGTTFISTKILLEDFTPIEILFFRFMLGLFVLIIAYPHRLKVTDKKHEVLFACAGLCGITLYYLLENIALTYSMVSNVGIIISIAPFFTAIFAHYFIDGERLKLHFIIGFISAIIGIILISFSSYAYLKLNPIGDLLAVMAAAVWAAYSILSRKISSYGYHTIQTTRKTFTYGILFMLPTFPVFHFRLALVRFTDPINLFNLLFLGLGASALCFVTWNYAVKLLGAVKTSVYIYLVPVITVITSIIVLHEKVTWMAALGTSFTLAGLLISERLPNRQKHNNLSVKKLESDRI